MKGFAGLEIPHDAPPAVLRSLARSLEEQARALERAAAEREATLNMRAENGRILDACRAAGLEAWKRVAAGQDRETAAAMVAEAARLPIETVLAHMRRAERDAADQRRQARDREMLTLAAKGWTNAELARRFGLHEKTVQRAISRARQAR